MIKKITVLSFLFFFLISCGSEITISDSGLVKTETENLSIDIPSNWNVIENVDEILPKPKDAHIELAVTSQNIESGFANNLLILSDDLKTFVSSKDYSMLNNVWASSDYIDYNKLSSKDFTFLDEEVSTLYVFEARYNLDTPKLKFLQTAHICNQNKWFFLTIAIPTTISDTSKYEYLLSTFACK